MVWCGVQFDESSSRATEDGVRMGGHLVILELSAIILSNAGFLIYVWVLVTPVD